MLKVLLLGSPLLLLDDHPVDGLRRKNRALLYYLAAGRNPQSRDHLLTLFWPDYERPAAQQILRTMIHDLRKYLGAALLAEGDSLALDGVDVDAQRFRTQLVPPPTDITALRDTLALYRDDFLKDFTLPDSPEFDDWAATEREHYRTLALRAMGALGQLYERNRDYPAALAVLEAALRIDPLQEDLQRACIRLQHLSGDRPGAILRYDRLNKLLDEELGVPPMAETRALYDAIIGDMPLVVDRTPADPVSLVGQARDSAFLPFVGRAAELEQLESGLSPGKLVLVEGEPGIGKTRLVDVFLNTHTQRKPALVLRGNAYELEQGLPYQPVIDALRGLLDLPEWRLLKAEFNLVPLWLAEVARLIPELALEFPALPAPPAAPNEARLWESLKQFFAQLSRRRSLIVFVDDLQWADASTLGFLGYLVRRSESLPLLLIATARKTATEPAMVALMQALQHERRLARLTLEPLTTGDVLALAQHFSPSESRAFSEWLGTHAEGNPYFVAEMIRYAYGNRLIERDGSLNHDALDWNPVLPPTIHNLIESRLMRLSETAHQVLELAAVVGYQFAYVLIAHVLALSESTLLDAVDELVRAGLIQAQGDEQFSFDHALTLEVAYRAMGAARHRALHRRVAEALEAVHQGDLDAAAGVIAYHFVRSTTPDRALPYALRAGQRASRLAAWAEAIAFYDQALAGLVDPAQRADVFMARGEARFHSGALTHATEDFTGALELARERGDLEALERAYVFLNESLLPQARFGEAIALGAELRRTGPPQLALCAEFIWGAGLAIESAHSTEAEAHIHEAERLLDQPISFKSRITRALVTYQLISVMTQQGRIAEAVALSREVLRFSEQDETALDLLRQIMLYNHLAYNLLLLGDPSAADYARAGVKAAQEKGVFSHLPYLLSTSGEIALAQNDPDAAEQFFRQGLSIAEEIPIPERIAGLTANLGLVAQARGQTERARDLLLRALDYAATTGNQHLTVRIRLWLASVLPRAEARDCLREARTTAETGGFTRLLDAIQQLEDKLI